MGLDTCHLLFTSYRSSAHIAHHWTHTHTHTHTHTDHRRRSTQTHSGGKKGRRQRPHSYSHCSTIIHSAVLWTRHVTTQTITPLLVSGRAANPYPKKYCQQTQNACALTELPAALVSSARPFWCHGGSRLESVRALVKQRGGKGQQAGNIYI